jgi:large subunit ribosomal protein L17
MRHRKKINHLGRQKAHRKSLLSNMAASLILHKRISTTVAKAKALRTFVEPLITKSKEDTTHSRRVVFSYLQDKNAVTELFRDVSVKVGDRPGGYTRILKTGLRMGDNADMCFIELVDYNEAMLESTAQKEKKSRRKRGAKKAKVEETTKETKVVEETVAEETIAEEPVAEEVVAEEPVAEEVVAEEPVAEEVVAEEPVAEEPVAEEPASEEAESNQEEEEKKE